MAVTLALGRCRARDFKLLIQIRRVAALSLARGIRFYFRWLPSEFNNAEAGSRLDDENANNSKNILSH